MTQLFALIESPHATSNWHRTVSKISRIIGPTHSFGVILLIQDWEIWTHDT